MLRPWRRNREHRSKPQPYDNGGFIGETRYPAVLHPDECVLNPQLRCIRPDHQHHGGEPLGEHD